MKTYLPIHSSNPELRFVVEKATMEKPIIPDINNYLYGENDFAREQYSMDTYHYECNLIIYEQHLASLTKYPFPALPADCPDEMIEGVDFELAKEYSFPSGVQRIIAVPISVKAESISTQSGASMEDVIVRVQKEKQGNDISVIRDQ